MTKKTNAKAATVCAAAFSLASIVASADKTISGEVQLSGHTDWTDEGTVTLSAGATLDLNGYSLAVDSLAGEGTITSKVSYVFDKTPKQTSATSPNTVTSYWENASGNLTEITLTSPAWRAFADYPEYDNSNQRVCYAYKTEGKNFDPKLPLVIEYAAPAALYADSYKIQAGNTDKTSPGRAPNTWKVFGSNDGTTWTEIDSRSSVTWETYEIKTFPLNTPGAYSHYRFRFTANNGDVNALEFFKMELGCTATYGLPTVKLNNATLSGDIDARGVELQVAGTVELAGHELAAGAISGSGTITDSGTYDLTTPSGTVTAIGTFLDLNPFNDADHWAGGYRAIADLNVNPQPGFIYTFDDATVVDSYRLYVGTSDTADDTSAQTTVQRAPKAWKLYGSPSASGDGDWTELDSREMETGWTMTRNWGEERQYDFDNAAAYRRYKVVFSENNGAQHLEFFKMELGSRAAAGTLRVAPPEGTTVENSTLSISGNLAFVKDGAGTFTATKTQSYGCGTEVAAGTLKCGAAVSSSSSPFGAFGRGVVVREGAVLDANGMRMTEYIRNTAAPYGQIVRDYGIVLDGGTLANGGDYTTGHDQFRRIRLTQDATFSSTHNSWLGTGDYSKSVVSLGGHRLSVDIPSGKYLRMTNVTFWDGSVVISGGGTLAPTYYNDPKDEHDLPCVATNVDFTIGCALYMSKRLSVRDYVATYTGTANNMAKELAVYGTFRPEKASFYGCTLKDGATIDLTAWPAGWPVASSSATGNKTLAFESGTAAAHSTVTVEIDGERSDVRALARDKGYLLKWSAAPENVDFVLGSGAGAKYRIAADAGGLMLYRAPGMTVIIK